MSRPGAGTMSFVEMMTLVSHGPDTYVGAGPSYPWGGLYGGQVVAQALCAAGLTTEAGYLPHSLHAYFIRLGDAAEPVRFEVERLRDGRSFVTRHVVARQSTGAILNMAASFQTSLDVQGEPAVDVQLCYPPCVPGPDAGEEVSWGPLYEMRLVEGLNRSAEGGPPPGPWPIRLDEGQTSACSWFRVLEDLSAPRSDLTGAPAGHGAAPLPGPAVASAALLHAAALAYLSDSGPAWLAGAVHAAEARPESPWRPVSLDHTIWFHRPADSSQWSLFQASLGSLYNSRGLALGQVFSAGGVLVATIAQEVLLRRPNPSAGDQRS